MISSFLLQDIPRHPDTRLFEVRGAFKRSLLLDFQAHIRAYIALRSTDTEPGTYYSGRKSKDSSCINMNAKRSLHFRPEWYVENLSGERVKASLGHVLSPFRNVPTFFGIIYLELVCEHFCRYKRVMLQF